MKSASREVRGIRDAGEQATMWDGRDGDGRMAASGVYFLRLQGDGEIRTRKVLLLR